MSAQQDGMTRTELLKASPPMFESRFLDACSRVHPSVPVILFLPAIVVLLVLGIGRGCHAPKVARRANIRQA